MVSGSLTWVQMDLSAADTIRSYCLVTRRDEKKRSSIFGTSLWTKITVTRTKYDIKGWCFLSSQIDGPAILLILQTERGKSYRNLLLTFHQEPQCHQILLRRTILKQEYPILFKNSILKVSWKVWNSGASLPYPLRLGLIRLEGWLWEGNTSWHLRQSIYMYILFPLELVMRHSKDGVSRASWRLMYQTCFVNVEADRCGYRASAHIGLALWYPFPIVKWLNPIEDKQAAGIQSE